MVRAGEDVDKGDYLHTAGGNANYFACYWKQYRNSFKKLKTDIPYDPESFFWVDVQRNQNQSLGVKSVLPCILKHC